MTFDVTKFALEVTSASLAAVVVAQFQFATPDDIGEQAVETALTRLQGTLEGLVLLDGDDEEVLSANI